MHYLQRSCEYLCLGDEWAASPFFYTRRYWGPSVSHINHYVYSDSSPVISRIGQIWDPTLGAYRSQRLPIALSKSSVARIDDGDTAKAARASYSLNSASTSLEKTGPTGPSRNLSSNLHSHSSAHSLRNLLIFHRAKALHVTGDASKTLSPNWCKDLPPEVYDCILDHLKIIHEVPISQGCQTCHLRDLYSLALTSRTWDKAVAERM